MERHPAHQKLAGLTPGRGRYLGCRFDPQSGRVGETTDQCFSRTLMSLSLLSPLCKNQRLCPQVRVKSDTRKTNIHEISWGKFFLRMTLTSVTIPRRHSPGRSGQPGTGLFCNSEGRIQETNRSDGAPRASKRERLLSMPGLQDAGGS